MTVKYERSSYVLSEEIGYVEICVISSSPGIQSQFFINVTTTEPMTGTLHCRDGIIAIYEYGNKYIYIYVFFTDSISFIQSAQSLSFAVDTLNTSDRQCYTISINFDMDDYCEHYSNCSNLLQSHLTKYNDSDHVVLINNTDEVLIKENNDTCGKMPLRRSDVFALT